MTVDFALHCCAGIRVAQHYPENANSISLTIERKGDNANVTLFGLPPAVTDKLVGAFGADVEPVINGNGKVAQLVKAAQAVLADLNLSTRPVLADLERALQRFPEFKPIEYRPGDIVAADCACGAPVTPPQREPITDAAVPSMVPMCELCGHPMPPGEEMFKYHGASGPCPTDRKAAT